MVTKVWHRLSVGSLEDAERLAMANPSGIKTVISFCNGEVLPQRDGIQYVHIPVADATPISNKKFEEIMTAIADSIRTGSVLLHCAAGMSRAPILCAAWMQRCGYASIDAALSEIEEMRPITDPSHVLLSSVRRLLQ